MSEESSRWASYHWGDGAPAIGCLFRFKHLGFTSSYAILLNSADVGLDFAGGKVGARKVGGAREPA